MKKVLMIIIVLVIAIAVWFVVFRKKSGGDDSPKPKPVATSKHSDSLNHSFRAMIGDYYALVEGFVNWDSSVISSSGNSLKSSLAAININELKKDSTIYLTALMFWDN